MKLLIQEHEAFIYTGGKTFKTSADKPTLVFIHGAQQDHSCWGLQSRYFAHHGYPVLTPDLPAHGSSQGEPLTSIEAMSAWIQALLTALSVEKAILIGHSMGSLIALETALQNPVVIEKVVLIGTSLPMPVSPALLEAAANDEAQAAALINQWSYSPRAQRGGSAIPGLWLLGMNQQLMARQRQGVFAADLNACNNYQRELNSLKTLDKPVLMLAGSLDKMTSPKVLHNIQQSLPKARLQILAGAGHALMAEQPDQVVFALKNFVA